VEMICGIKPGFHSKWCMPQKAFAYFLVQEKNACKYAMNMERYAANAKDATDASVTRRKDRSGGYSCVMCTCIAFDETRPK